MFIVKDQLCDGTQWHVRTVPTNPAVEPYFPIGQAALSLIAESGTITVALKTMTPHFKQYEIRLDRADWKVTSDHFVWSLHPGLNRLEARTINQFGVTGPLSTAEFEVKASE